MYIDFTVKYWQLGASTFTVIFTGIIELLQELPRRMGVRMGNLKIPYGSLHPITKTYLFKYTENFTSKERIFSGEKILLFSIFLLKA